MYVKKTWSINATPAVFIYWDVGGNMWTLPFLFHVALSLAIWYVAYKTSPPRPPYVEWLTSYLMRAGALGLLAWLVVEALWGWREVLVERGTGMGPVEGTFEYATWWGAVLTAALHLAVLGIAAALQILAEEVETATVQPHRQAVALVVDRRARQCARQQ